MFTFRWILPQRRLGLLWAAAAVALAGSPACGANLKGDAMSYREAKEFLSRHTRIVELTNKEGARVAISPEWQGRVMTSTCDGPEGLSFGFINRQFIEAGEKNPHFNNYGAEDRLWFSPEGGPFSLWFKPGAEQTLENWYTPPAFNEGPFEVTSPPEASACRMHTQMKFDNTAGMKFHLAVTRVVRLLEKNDYPDLFGKPAGKTLTQSGVKKVGYESINTITNIGRATTKEKGLVSIWMLGMFNASPKTVVIVPYKSGDEKKLGPVVKSDYFGEIPPERLKITPEAILFLGDGNYRSKIGTSQKRAENVAGSIDFDNGVLTLVHFTMPKDPAKVDYMNNMWGPQEDSYSGDVANAYNDGPPAPGQKGLGAFYEIESLSPAVEMKTGQSLGHSHRTVHVQADPETLAELAKEVLGVDLEAVRKEMFGK